MDRATKVKRPVLRKPKRDLVVLDDDQSSIRSPLSQPALRAIGFLVIGYGPDFHEYSILRPRADKA